MRRRAVRQILAASRSQFPDLIPDGISEESDPEDEPWQQGGRLTAANRGAFGVRLDIVILTIAALGFCVYILVVHAY